MPSIISFDTLAYSQDRQNAGMDRALANVITKRQREAFEKVLDAHQLVAKQDLHLEIEKICSDLTQSIEKVRSDITQNIEKVSSSAQGVPWLWNSLSGTYCLHL